MCVSQPFNFPILDNDALLGRLEEVGVIVRPLKLARPCWTTLQPVFEHMVLQLTEVTR